MMKKFVSLFFVVVLLFLSACGRNQPALPEDVLKLQFDTMTAQAFDQAAEELGWALFEENARGTGYFLGTFLGYEAYLTRMVNEATGRVESIQIVSPLRHESQREQIEEMLSRLPANEWNEARACSYYANEPEETAAKWLVQVRKALNDAGGKLEEGEPVVIDGTTWTEIAAFLQERIAGSEQMMTGAGERFYLFENQYSCRMDISVMLPTGMPAALGLSLILYDPSYYFSTPVQ